MHIAHLGARTSAPAQVWLLLTWILEHLTQGCCGFLPTLNPGKLHLENVQHSEVEHAAELPRLVEAQGNESMGHLCTLCCAWLGADGICGAVRGSEHHPEGPAKVQM